MGNYELEFDVVSETPSLNQLLSKGWKFRHFKFLKIKNEIKLKVSGHAPASPLTQFKISINRHATKTLDFDGLVASLKPIIDGLVLAGVLKNDDWTLINHINVSQTIVKKDQKKITVKVEGRLEEN